VSDDELKLVVKKCENCPMSSKIVNVDQMDDGVLVNFADGARSFFGADFLYEQMEKRLDPPLKNDPPLKSDLSKHSSVRLLRHPRDTKRK
jgi:CCR4-NOT transcriptional regulation complex NOT5 subunit